MSTRITHGCSGLGLGLVLLLAAVQTACTETTYQFDDFVVGGDDNASTPRPRTNSQFLRAVYADLLGRTPETYDLILYNGQTEVGRFPLDEQAIVLNALDDVGDPRPMRALLTTALTHSVEANIPKKSDVSDAEAFITEQFNKLLGRDPNPYELAAFASEWKSDSNVNPRTVIRALINSREYQSY